MKVFYRKNKNQNLFEKLENIAEIYNNQNYIPIYNNFFNINSNNYNCINLDNINNIVDLDKKINYSKFLGKIQKNNEIIENKQIFFKFSPLIDPVKYVFGKYDESYNILSLPNLYNINDLSCNQRIFSTNNASYCDSFFSYLSSKLLNEYNFLNGIDYYGSFLGIKKDFNFDISEELDSIDDSDYFKSNLNKNFKLLNSNIERMLINNTKKNKSKIIINTSKSNSINIKEIIINNDISNNINNNISNIINNELLNITSNDISDITSNDISDITSNDISNNYENLNKKFKKKNNTEESTISNSSCSSRTSNTNSLDSNDSDKSNDSDDSDDSDDSGNSSNMNDSYDSDNNDDEVICSVNNFPVQSILLECCDNTLDNYIINNKIKDDEWESIILQILFTLITYQKCFSFTHNDLHTNNIVYNKTEKQYLYYKYNNKHYKIPTFKKIYKIIDFGRAIYKYNNQTIFNDSYSKEGDAFSQYNCEPFFNESKPRVEPNFSFDLSRLGCSLFDYFIEDIDDIIKIKSKIKKIITSWVFDDKNKNILYKNNGNERYPDFKLYKMIARTVHNHTPQKVLNNELFEKYIVNKKKINKSGIIFNIDDLPVM